MFPTQNFGQLVIYALLIFWHASVTPSNLKIGLEWPKASRKPAKKIWGYR